MCMDVCVHMCSHTALSHRLPVPPCCSRPHLTSSEPLFPPPWCRKPQCVFLILSSFPRSAHSTNVSILYICVPDWRFFENIFAPVKPKWRSSRFEWNSVQEFFLSLDDRQCSSKDIKLTVSTRKRNRKKKKTKRQEKEKERRKGKDGRRNKERKKGRKKGRK